MIVQDLFRYIRYNEKVSVYSRNDLRFMWSGIIQDIPLDFMNNSVASISSLSIDDVSEIVIEIA